MKGYKQALTNINIDIIEELIFLANDLSSDEWQKGMEYFFNLALPPDGIFCSNDKSASAIQTIKKAKLRVPDDIAVVGFSNTPHCRAVTDSPD